jgi:hypothetical protein
MRLLQSQSLPSLFRDCRVTHRGVKRRDLATQDEIKAGKQTLNLASLFSKSQTTARGELAGE